MIRFLAALSLVFPLAAHAGTDQVIYDNGDSQFTGGTVMTNDRLPADDFVVTHSSIGTPEYVLSDIHFLASQVGMDTGNWDGRIRWYLFTDHPESPTPDELIASGEGVNITREFVEPVTGNVNEFAYGFDLDLPLSLESDTVYWLALNMGSTNFDIVWRTSAAFDDVQGESAVLGAVSTLPDPSPEDWSMGGRVDKSFFLTGYPLAEAISIEIDIKPFRYPNFIKPFRRSVIPVAMFGSDTFDIADVDVTTLAFGPAGAAPIHRWGGHLRNLNDDLFLDVVSHYRTRASGIWFGDTEACVTGELVDGTPFEGCDEIQTIPFW